MNYEITHDDVSSLSFLSILIFGFMLFLPDFSFAAPGPAVDVNAPNAISQVLCNVVGWFTGSVGTAIGTAAIIVVGIGFIMGKTSWGIVLATVAGLAVVFGSKTLVGLISGDSANRVCTGGVV